MTLDYICMEMEDGAKLYVQKAPIKKGGEMKASGGGAETVKAAEYLNENLPVLNKFFLMIKDEIQGGVDPDELELECSILFTGKGSIGVAAFGAEAGINVHMVWKNEGK